MSTALILQNTLIWLGLFTLGFVNGAIREVGIKRLVSEPYAHHLSVLTAIVIFTSYVFWIWQQTGIRSTQEAFMIGLYWLVLTVLTETFVLNRWMSKLSWEQILQSYNLTRGELWPLVVLWIGLLPLVIRFWKGPAA